jgi:hypothetical protein
VTITTTAERTGPLVIPVLAGLAPLLIASAIQLDDPMQRDMEGLL